MLDWPVGRAVEYIIVSFGSFDINVYEFSLYYI